MKTRAKATIAGLAASAVAVAIIVSMIPQATVDASFPITYPPFPPTEPEPEQEYRGWMAGHMSDRAKNCDLSGLGRPWCVLYGFLFG